MDLKPFYDTIFNLKEKFESAKISHITLYGNFSRGKALDAAARSPIVNGDDILFFIDVDITFQRETLLRIRQNTIKNKQVYLPIVFSQYDPSKIENDRTYTNNSHLSYDLGYFRQFGYGICAIYKVDVMHPDVDGFNTEINGWGLEDVKFLEKILKLGQKSNLELLNIVDETDTNPQKLHNQLNLIIFRSPDPSLVHIFHPIYCNTNLDESQYIMCLGTKANTLGSYRKIETSFLTNRTIIEHLSY